MGRKHTSSSQSRAIRFLGQNSALILTPPPLSGIHCLLPEPAATSLHPSASPDPALLLTGCVALSKSLSFSGLQVPHRHHGSTLLSPGILEGISPLGTCEFSPGRQPQANPAPQPLVRGSQTLEEFTFTGLSPRPQNQGLSWQLQICILTRTSAAADAGGLQSTL